MLDENLFTSKEIKESQVERSLLSLLEIDKGNNKIFKVNNLEEISKNSKYVLTGEDAIGISATVSNLEDKNIFLINESFNNIIQNINTSISDNFLKIYKGLLETIIKFSDKTKNMSVTILNMIDPDSRDVFTDISLLRNLNKVNIFIPADSVEAEYLIKVSTKNFFNNIQNKFSYFRLTSSFSTKIFSDDYFIKDGNLKEYTGLPEIIYVSQKEDSMFNILIISAGPILYNTLVAAKELVDRNYNVKVINMSLVSSGSEYINQKIKGYLNNLANNHKSILVVEEHSKVGGLGSFVAETVSENKYSAHVRVERLGLEDDLSPRNIIGKCEEIVGY